MPSKNKHSFRVGTGRASILVSPWRHSSGHECWRFKSLITGRDVRLRSKTKARDEARQELRTISETNEDFHGLTTTHKAQLIKILKAFPSEAELIGFLARNPLPTAEAGKLLPELAADFIASQVKKKSGKKTADLRSVELDLESLAIIHPRKTLDQLATQHLNDWLDHRTRNAGPKRKNDCRANAKKLYHYAERMGMIKPESLAQINRVPVLDLPLPPDIRYATTAEAVFLLKNISVEFRLWLVLGLFGGLRPEEILPEKARKRRGLDRREIDAETETIYIPREVAGKVSTVRRVPWAPHLRAWLEWAGWERGQSGPCSPRTPTRTPARARETLRLGALMDHHFQREEGWPDDFIRHTYASHRNAIIQNLDALATELGNSRQITQRHYNQPLPRATGEEFFALTPQHLEGETVVDFEFRRKGR